MNSGYRQLVIGFHVICNLLQLYPARGWVSFANLVDFIHGQTPIRAEVRTMVHLNENVCDSMRTKLQGQDCEFIYEVSFKSHGTRFIPSVQYNNWWRQILKSMETFFIGDKLVHEWHFLLRNTLKSKFIRYASLVLAAAGLAVMSSGFGLLESKMNGIIMKWIQTEKASWTNLNRVIDPDRKSV